MKFSISKTDLLNALTIVSKGRSSRTTLPILSGIYIGTTGEELVFHATDLEINVKHKIPALIEESGEVVVPGKLFFDVIKSLPEAAIQCTLKSDTFEISCMNSQFSMSIMNPKDFPSFPDLKCENKIELSSSSIVNMVKKVSKAISRDESHVILTGIYMNIEDEKLTLAATDSYRLATSELNIENHKGNFELVIPGTIFDDVCKLCGKDEIIEVEYNDNQIRFNFGNSTLITRKIEGTYPNYKQIIPTEKSITATINTKTIIDAVKRISIMAQEYMQIKLHIIPENQQMIISSKVADIGGAEEVLDIKAEGEEIEIGFNYQYLIDGLVSIDSEELIFEANKPLKPGIIKNVGNDKFLYLSMPVNINN